MTKKEVSSPKEISNNCQNEPGVHRRAWTVDLETLPSRLCFSGPGYACVLLTVRAVDVSFPLLRSLLPALFTLRCGLWLGIK